MSDKPAAVPVPAATILLLRDGDAGLEVFMVKRHHQIGFVAGALVFPGGKLEKGDSDAALAAHVDCDPTWTADMRALGAGAIREAFEESGIMLARQNLRLALDQLVHFAHWITPANMPKRFDTHFFLAVSPVGHAGSHDGRESVDSIWITPGEAISDRKRWNVIFPTKLNLMKLDKSKRVDAAIAAARAGRVLPVTPWVENGPDGQILKIRDDAGYAQTSANMKEAL